jgi:hypothetical protein
MTKPTNEITATKKLLISLENMSDLARGSLSRIRGIAKCALFAMETDSGVRDLEAIAEALKAIILDADMSHNDVGCEAENHGIQTIDKDWERRLHAMSGRQVIHAVTERSDS